MLGLFILTIIYNQIQISLLSIGDSGHTHVSSTKKSWSRMYTGLVFGRASYLSFFTDRRAGLHDYYN